MTTSKEQGKKGDNIKIVHEINRRKLEQIVYAAFMVGFLARAEGRTVNNPNNYEEIHNLIDLITP